MNKIIEMIPYNKFDNKLNSIEYEKYISRRSFMTFTIGALGSLTLNGGLSSCAQGGSKNPASNPASGFSNLDPFKGNLAIPPLFCTAYITPNAPGQENQEAAVARYPLTLVPQDNRRIFRTWRDKVKTINPKIFMLGYLVVIEETTVPGPGHDMLRNIYNSWCVYPDGSVPTVGNPSKKRRIFDPRNKEWRNLFLEACHATLASYPYNGLFLDQCTIFDIASPIPQVREEMKVALQETLLDLRKELPNIILVGNSSYNWAGLNGEMNEGRYSDIKDELGPFYGHVMPRVELVQTLLRNKDDFVTVKREMNVVHTYGGFYGACVNYQHVLWYDIFEKVINDYNKYL